MMLPVNTEKKQKQLFHEKKKGEPECKVSWNCVSFPTSDLPDMLTCHLPEIAELIRIDLWLRGEFVVDLFHFCLQMTSDEADIC